jgi:hypothetical protein
MTLNKLLPQRSPINAAFVGEEIPFVLTIPMCTFASLFLKNVTLSTSSDTKMTTTHLKLQFGMAKKGEAEESSS